MFLKRNHSRQGGKAYHSVLLVEGVRVPVPKGPGRPRKGAVAKTKVVHRVLANLSRLPESLLTVIEHSCKGTLPTGDAPTVRTGPCYGVLAGLHALAGELGLVAALGPDRPAKLALFLIYARLAWQGSRLAAVRWAEDQAVREVLGLDRFDEDDLYAALAWLQTHQVRLEQALAPAGPAGAVYLYDVTSSSFEGQKNELAAHGYNRDGKRYKKQVVLGLLTDADGEPRSIRLFPGNPSDPQTFGRAVATLKV
jgi:hypothetical protein